LVCYCFLYNSNIPIWPQSSAFFRTKSNQKLEIMSTFQSIKVKRQVKKQKANAYRIINGKKY